MTTMNAREMFLSEHHFYLHGYEKDLECYYQIFERLQDKYYVYVTDIFKLFFILPDGKQSSDYSHSGNYPFINHYREGSREIRS